MRKIVVCPDSFKGSFSSVEIASAIDMALRKRCSDVEIIKLPLADGGEGTSELLKFKYPVKRTLLSFDSLKRPLKTYYLTDDSGKRGFIESASVLGLSLLKPSERNPLAATSYGLGILIRNAIESGCREISVSLGGSAVCDGGMGMLEALGFRFVDEKGSRLEGNGLNLLKINAIDSSHMIKELEKVRVRSICDVVNPLFGPDGAACVFAPQKGANPTEVVILDKGLRNIAELTKQLFTEKEDSAYLKGAGAAGGLGFSLTAFLNADSVSGIEFLLDQLDFDRIIEGADYIVTGEGKADRQSLMGKVLSGVLERARPKNIPVIAIAGSVDDEESLQNAGVMKIIPISDPSLSLTENMKKEQTVKNINRVLARKDLFN